MDSEANVLEDDGAFEDAQEEVANPRTLPADLPKSLDDRQPVHQYGAETEMYDAWAGTAGSMPTHCILRAR